MKLEESKTFILALTVIVLSFVGVWQKMFEPDVFTQAVTWAIGVYGTKTVISKQINKKPKPEEG